MNNLSKFCTCENFSCPLHPTKHEKGCAPCISKNLRLKEIPACFFNCLDNSDTRTDDSFESFAKLMECKKDCGWKAPLNRPTAR